MFPPVICVFCVGSGFAMYLSSNSVFVHATRFLKTIVSSERLFHGILYLVEFAGFDCRYCSNLARLTPVELPTTVGDKGVMHTTYRNTMWGAFFAISMCWYGIAILRSSQGCFCEFWIFPKPLIPWHLSMYIQQGRMSKRKPANYGKCWFPSTISCFIKVPLNQ